MKTQIHELRIRIDRLAQLIYSIGTQPILAISKDSVPCDIIPEEFAIEYKKIGAIILTRPEEIIHESGLSFLAEAYKSLLLAKAWLGKILKGLGEEIAEDKSIPLELKVQTNETKPIGAAVRDMTYSESIDWIYDEIKHIIAATADVLDGLPYGNLMIEDGTFTRLTEAQFFIEFELSRLKEQEG